MIYLNGVNLVADELGELHRFAYKMGVEKVWYRAGDECYDVISPFKLEQIVKYIKKLNKKNPHL